MGGYPLSGALGHRPESQAGRPPADTAKGDAEVSSEMRQWIWVMVGAVLLGLLSGGLALGMTRLTGIVLTPTTVVLLAAIYATGIAAGLLVATAVVNQTEEC